MAAGSVGRAMQQASQVFQSSSHMQHVSTISHLETQMATCLALRSASEYRFWLETYVRYLAQEGNWQPKNHKQG